MPSNRLNISWRQRQVLWLKGGNSHRPRIKGRLRPPDSTASQRAQSSEPTGSAGWPPWTCRSMSPVSASFSTPDLLLLHCFRSPGVLSLSSVKAVKEINIPLISIVDCCEIDGCWRSWMKEVVLRYKVGLWLYISGALWCKAERQWHKCSQTLELFPGIWNVLKSTFA